MKKNKKGFTLVEIIIVISLLIVIAGIFSINIIASLNKQKVEENENVVSQILSAASTYVSVNPDEVENLYNGYGYVDIPVGHLRDAGLLSEEIKNSETGEKIKDEEKVRIKLNLGDYLDFTYPVQKDTAAWKFIVEDLTINYDGGYTGNWCNNSTGGVRNVFTGLVTAPFDPKYPDWPSKMYLMNNKENDAERFRMFSGNYFDTSAQGTNLRVESCNVNPKSVGTYTITYKYFDKELNTEKTANRTVYVNSSKDDVISFTAAINIDPATGKETPIVRGEVRENVPIRITETYRNGSSTFTELVKNLEKRGYDIQDFTTQKVGSNLIATVSRSQANSDGSYPAPQKPKYNVITDAYTLTYDVNGGYALNPNNKTVTVRRNYGYPSSLAVPSKRGYNFDYWYTSETACKRLNGTITYDTRVPSETLSNNKIVENICNQTAKAHWTPKRYTVYFNANGGHVNEYSRIVTYDSTYGTLPTPSRTGYTFLGWYTNPSGGSPISSNTIVNIEADQVLYAHWRANQYRVSFSGGDGYLGSRYVTFDSSYGILPTPYIRPTSDSYRSGNCTITTTCYFTFQGWRNGGSYVNSYTRVTTPYDHTLTASFSRSCNSSTYCPPPPRPPSRPSGGSSGGSGGGGSSGSGNSGTTTKPPTSCKNSCGHACSNSAADQVEAGSACSSDWHSCTTQACKDDLHDKAQNHYGAACGSGNQDYNSGTGTTSCNGTQMSPKF